MRRWTLLMCVGWLAATVAAPWMCAQNSSSHKRQNGAPVADQFVSTPGQMVSTPGQRVTGPGQMVTTPGQMVIPPGQMVIAPGQSIAPTPGVIAPFHSQTQQFQGQGEPQPTGKRGVVSGRRHQNRHEYRPEYGAAGGYAVPYVAENSYGTGAATASGAIHGSDVAPRTMVRASPGQADSGMSPQSPLAEAPSGNRPPYRGAEDATPSAPPNAPNVIQSREPALRVVMKDGSQRTVRNYALTPKMLINLDDAASGKEAEIPLSEIDVAATERAAAQAGLSFSVPTS